MGLCENNIFAECFIAYLIAICVFCFTPWVNTRFVIIATYLVICVCTVKRRQSPNSLCKSKIWLVNIGRKLSLRDQCLSFRISSIILLFRMVLPTILIDIKNRLHHKHPWWYHLIYNCCQDKIRYRIYLGVLRCVLSFRIFVLLMLQKKRRVEGKTRNCFFDKGVCNNQYKVRFHESRDNSQCKQTIQGSESG